MLKTKKKLAIIPVELAPVREVEILADSIVYGVESAQGGVFLAVGAPEGATGVGRKIWMVATGMEISVEAQNSLYVGTVIIEGASPGEGLVPPRVLYAVFVEKQEDALTRQHHRGVPR